MRPRHNRRHNWDDCFVATAAYGTPWERNVWKLRSFRDECLLSTEVGRGFVALYYATSPPVADAIRSRPWARGATRVALTPVVVVAGALTGDLGDMAIVAAGVALLCFVGPRLRRAAKRRRRVRAGPPA